MTVLELVLCGTLAVILLSAWAIIHRLRRERDFYKRGFNYGQPSAPMLHQPEGLPAPKRSNRTMFGDSD